MTSRTFTARIIQDDNTTMTGFEIPFDPKPVFGKVRAPVTVTIRKHIYRSTISAMGGCWMIPLRKSNRDAAGVKAGEKVKVTLALDERPRTVTPPPELAKALRAAGLKDAFKSLSYTCQREHAEAVEGAKKEETRDRRIAACLAMIRSRAAKH